MIMELPSTPTLPGCSKRIVQSTLANDSTAGSAHCRRERMEQQMIKRAKEKAQRTDACV